MPRHYLEYWEPISTNMCREMKVKVVVLQTGISLINTQETGAHQGICHIILSYPINMVPSNPFLIDIDLSKLFISPSSQASPHFSNNIFTISFEICMCSSLLKDPPPPGNIVGTHSFFKDLP